MMKPQTPPCVARPHITDIGMMPQVWYFVQPRNSAIMTNLVCTVLNWRKGNNNKQLQVFSPPEAAKQEPPTNMASPLLPASKGTFSSRRYWLSANNH